MCSSGSNSGAAEIPIYIAKDLTKNGYEPIRFIGRGGFSNCYLVRSVKYNQNFACKVVNIPVDASKTKQNSFDNEFRALTNIIHANIIKIYNTFTVYDKDTESRNIYLILEYCTHGDLEHYVATNGPIKNEFQFLSCVMMMLESLSYLEKNNIAHNDIKPANFLIDEYNKIKISDFGLTKQLENESHLSTEFVGSVPFLAPEIVNKRPYNPLKSDVWAFGVTVFFLATGRFPFKSHSVQALRESQNHGVINFPSRINPLIKVIVTKCLHVHPENRVTFGELHQLVKAEMETYPQQQQLIKLHNVQKYHKSLNLSYIKSRQKIVVPRLNHTTVLTK